MTIAPGEQTPMRLQLVGQFQMAAVGCNATLVENDKLDVLSMRSLGNVTPVISIDRIVSFPPLLL